MHDKMLFADKPLTDPDMDRLHHAALASSLAESICKMVPPDGLVMAIYGPWGSGKSTLIEFIVHYLEQKAKPEKPIIIRFNPWWFSGQENLIRHFFDQLYASFGSAFGKGVRKLISSVKHLSDLVAEAPVSGAKLPKVIADKLPSPEKRDVTRVKRDISNILRQAGHRVLIIIDDIDRLNAEEIRQLFALIKAVADFPNVIYLLAFDRKIVADALSSIHGVYGNGDKFLEKIVQVPFEIPSITDNELRDIFLEKIGHLVNGIPTRLFEDQLFGARGYLTHIQSFISTPRDVFRLVNALTVTYASVSGEVDPADFIAIESLRVFRPDLYNIVRSNKFVFTSQYAPNAEQPRIREILQNENQQVQNLIIALFPNLRGGTFGSQQEHQWRKELRVCSPDIFDIYFRFSIPRSGISRQEMLDIIERARHNEKLGEFLVRTTAEDLDKGRHIFYRFPDYFEEIQVAEVIPLARILLDIGDEIITFDEENPEPPGFRTPLRFAIANIIIELSKKVDSEKQLEKLKDLLSTTRSYYLPLHVIYMIGRRHGRYDNQNYVPDDAKILKPENIPELEEIAISKIHNVLDSITDFGSKDLRNVLHFWALIDSDGPKNWVQTKLNTSIQVVEFIKGFISWMGFEFYDVSDTLFLYFNPVDLRKLLADSLESGDLDATQRKVAEVFLDATQKYDNSDGGQNRD